jgi:hypothetical protein
MPQTGVGDFGGRADNMKREIWIFLFLLGFLFFSWPLMSIFKDNLAISLFVIWLVFIILIFVTSIFSEKEDGGG